MTSDGNWEVANLRSPVPSDRARAAAWLVARPQKISTRDLMQAIQNETVPQVRRVLNQVLEARQRPERVPDPQGRSRRTDQFAELTQVDVAALIRHELSPAVGWIRLAADSEIEDFSLSKTNAAIRKLQRRIDGLVAVIKSEQGLSPQLVAIPQILLDNWPDAGTSPRCNPSADGSEGVEILTDEGLFSLLISNVLQNALDASIDAVGRVDVEIAWGHTDQNYWVRVMNPFRGNGFALADVMGLGRSSKVAHKGHGLALISSAAERLGISIALEGVSGIASFTLSGSRPDE